MRYLLTVLILLSPAGCTITGDHYLRNLTGETISISLKTTSTINLTRVDLPIFKFSDEVIEIKRKAYKKMGNELTPEILSENEISLNLPPTSTIYLGTGSNSDPHMFEKLVISRNGKNEVINLNTTQKFKSGRSGPFHYAAYLDIE